MKRIKIKITKLTELPEAKTPNNIPEGFEKTFNLFEEFFEKPELNKRFYLGAFSTSPVQEIISDDTFRTFNSVYKWEYIIE